MSVLIKGMEMPESCSGCAIRYEMFCPIRHRFIADEGRRKNCPLIPIPPHGRLIDADALEDELGQFCDDNWVYNTLHHAPTIIDGGDK